MLDGVRAGGIVTVTFGLMLAGCAGSSNLMADAPSPAPALTPAPGTAVVVFVRDSGIGFAVNFTILDQSGQFVGVAVAQSHFAVQVPPGRFLFIAQAEDADVVQATLAPDRIYYIRVIPQMGALYARVRLDPIKPAEVEWKELPQLLAETKRLVVLREAGQRELNADRETLAKYIKEGNDEWASLSPEDRAAHTLDPNDGAHSGARPPPQYPPPGAPGAMPVAAPPPYPPGPAGAPPPAYPPGPPGAAPPQQYPPGAAPPSAYPPPAAAPPPAYPPAAAPPPAYPPPAPPPSPPPSAPPSVTQPPRS